MPDLSPAATKALSAARAGWFVFPIRPGAKKPPLVKHWREESSNSPDRVMEWASAYPTCNWGLDCGRSGLTVLDVDGAEGMASMTQYESEHGTFEPTFTVATPRGGLHLYFSGQARTTARTLGPGLDTRGEGGYVVFADSVVDGKSYRITKNSRPAKLPKWLTKLLDRAKPAPTPQGPTDPQILLDAPSNVSKAELFLQGADGAVEGSGGDIWTYQVACELKDLGISEALALDMMVSIFNPKCTPEWSLDDLKKKIRNAYKYGQNSPGLDTPEADFESVPGGSEEAPPEDDEDFPVMGADIVARVPKEREWIIQDWLPVGEVASLYGDGGQGKSLVGLQLALAVATGTSWLGLRTTKTPMAAFCLFCEDDKDEACRRLHSAMRGMPGEFGMERLHVWCRPGKNSVLCTAMPSGNVVPSAFFHRLKRTLKEMDHIHKLVILDTLADIYSGSELNREHVSRFIKVWLKGLAQDTNSTILMLAHPSRAGLKDGDLLSGSTAWSNSVRMRWTLAPHDKNPEVRMLGRMKSNYSSRGETLLLKWEEGRFVCIQETDADVETSPGFEADTRIVMDKISRAAAAGVPFGKCKPAANPITGTSLRDSKRRPMTADYVSQCVDYLIKMGYVEHVKRKGTRKALWPVGNTPESVFETMM